MIQWLFHTDVGLITRIAVGCAIFATLALIDFRRNRLNATRWREYCVLLGAVSAAMLYGAVNDQITVTISPEYFIYGKELFRVIGEQPSMEQLHWEAAKVGFKATWSVGLMIGVMLLLTNNPFRRMPRLRNRELAIYLPTILIIAAGCGALGGWLGYHGYLTRMDSDFEAMVEANIYRPQRFMSCWGVHLGGYIGGLIGSVLPVVGVIRRRWALGRVE